jgi:aminoglycoside 3-N-acetyltransferase
MVSTRDVHSLLRDFGIAPDDKVTVHSSLRAVGPIENGADGLIDALCAYLREGLLLIPTHTWRDFSRLSYDVKESVPCLGVLSRVAACRPDAVRSLHPTHSLAGFGRTAAEYLAGEERCTTITPPTSALGRLYEERGKILLIGVDHRSNTFLHSAEERLRVPNRISSESFVFSIRTADGNILKSAGLHPFHSEGIPRGASEYFSNYAKPLEECGAVTRGTLGDAEVLCCDAFRTVEVLRMLWGAAEYDLCSCEREIPERYYRK